MPRSSKKKQTLQNILIGETITEDETVVIGETIVTPAICCPVADCEAILDLQPHPTIPGRLVAYCNCKSIRRGLSVYEANAEPIKED